MKLPWISRHPFGVEPLTFKWGCPETKADRQVVSLRRDSQSKNEGEGSETGRDLSWSLLKLPGVPSHGTLRIPV